MTTRMSGVDFSEHVCKTPSYRPYAFGDLFAMVIREVSVVIREVSVILVEPSCKKMRVDKIWILLVCHLHNVDHKAFAYEMPIERDPLR
eukprot:4109433-Amphidinium_carterae.1